MSGQTVEELMQASWGTTPQQRVALLVQAVELADAQGDIDAGFDAREQLVSASYYVPGTLELLTSFSWLLARHDDDPQRFPLSLWSYKWVVHALPQMLAVSLDQIEDVVADVERRFEAAGESRAPAAKLRMIVASLTGDMDKMGTYLQEWQDALAKRRGWLNDCRACDEASYVDKLILLGDDERALAEAESLIDGRSRCATEPHNTFSILIGPARRVGPDGLATDLRKRGYRLVRDDPRFYSTMQHYIRDSLQSGDLARSAELVAKHQSWGEGSAHSEHDLFEFAAAARQTFLRYDHIGKALPDSLADTRTGGRTAAEVAQAFITQAEDLGTRFDQRNGNTFNTEILDKDRVFATR